MENKIIKIPAVNYGKYRLNESILLSLNRILVNYKCDLYDPNNHLISLIKEYEEDNENVIKELESRKNTWKKLLNKYYKMTCEYEIPGYSYKQVSYIYPYNIVDSNNTLWMLEVREGDDYEGGVKDKNYTIDCNWNYDTYLEEITEEEFRNKANEAAKHVIDRRLSRLSEPYPEYNIL